MGVFRHENREEEHFRAFQRISDLPDVEPLEDDDDAVPDFRVPTTRGIVGVEHTRILHRENDRGLPLVARERYIGQVIRRSKALYEANDNTPAIIHLSFETDPVLDEDIARELAHRLVDLVEQNLPSNPDERPRRTLRRRDHRNEFPSQIYSISILRLPGLETSRWLPTPAGWSIEISPSRVQEVINDKNDDIARYRSRCDTAWLLIAIDGRLPSSFYEIPQTTLGHTYQSSFDRTYLLHYEKGELHDLVTQPPE